MHLQCGLVTQSGILQRASRIKILRISIPQLKYSCSTNTKITTSYISFYLRQHGVHGRREAVAADQIPA